MGRSTVKVADTRYQNKFTLGFEIVEYRTAKEC